MTRAEAAVRQPEAAPHFAGAGATPLKVPPWDRGAVPERSAPVTWRWRLRHKKTAPRRARGLVGECHATCVDGGSAMVIRSLLAVGPRTGCGTVPALGGTPQRAPSIFKAAGYRTEYQAFPQGDLGCSAPRLLHWGGKSADVRHRSYRTTTIDLSICTALKRARSAAAASPDVTICRFSRI